ncbi:hypothetical protein CIB84_017541 [Bambusicola thoracicus]|uniref:RING-type domain-containing protein n=1 Tax=Bambusicola thoracicus TaxID=9083 RepID=A0A2P4S3K1_BAMTH|nr:hypothetical protein CIB84_017541 [Bambusicola thoracicus]
MRHPILWRVQHFSPCPSLPSSPRSFCWEHHPQQAVEAAPTQDSTCIFCMEPVADSRPSSRMVCPACQHAWFHRACIQEQALCAGVSCFQCPLCRDRERFIQDMITMGIRIPFRLVSFFQLFRCEGRRAESAQGLHRQAWPFAAINMGLSTIGKLEVGIGWKWRDAMD